MLYFYRLPQPVCVLISMISAGGVILQMVALVFNLFRRRASWIAGLESVMETLILLHMLLLSMMMAHMVNSARDDLIIGADNILLRLAVFVGIAVSAGAVCIFRRRIETVAIIAAATLTLSIFEKFLGFPALYGSALGFWIIRSIRVCVIRYHEIKTSISELSIKEAMDALHTGLLFCESDGYIVLVNRRMQSLMVFLTDEIWKNGRLFYEKLTDGKLRDDCKRVELDGRMVYRLPNKSVWMFSEKTIQIDRKRYYQVSAADVTERWDATIRLREQNDELDIRRSELKETIANLKTIYREEETLRAKRRVHDIMGQRIAILIRTLQEKERPDGVLLRAMADGLFTDLRETNSERSAWRDIEIMVEMYAGIGVRVNFQGELPKNPELAEIFTDIITEGATNAVRHGFSTEIDIACEKTDVEYRLEITNNGIPPRGDVVEGSGIDGMRRRIAGVGGTLVWRFGPTFVIMATATEEEA